MSTAMLQQANLSESRQPEPYRTLRHKRSLRRAIFLSIVVVLCLLPLVWTVLASLEVQANDTFSPPTWTLPPTLDRYLEVGIAEPEFMPELLTSAGLSATTTLLTTIVAFLSAYSLARSRFRGRSLLVQSFLVLASLPVISYLIPLRNGLDALRLTDTFVGTVLAETALYAPLAAYVLYCYCRQVSVDLEESASLDGATPLQVIWGVVLPMVVPGVAATAIIVFVLSWNQWLMPLVLSARLKTVPTAMIDFFTFERELEWPTAAAALIAWLLPIGMFVAVAHRLLERFSLNVPQDVD
jgi:ABC-type glycerol-3-phosphate transport system permease component